MSFLPRRALETSENEIARAFKLSGSTLEPLGFIVPRKADNFQVSPVIRSLLSNERVWSRRDLISLEKLTRLDFVFFSTGRYLPSCPLLRSSPHRLRMVWRKNRSTLARFPRGRSHLRRSRSFSYHLLSPYSNQESNRSSFPSHSHSCSGTNSCSRTSEEGGTRRGGEGGPSQDGGFGD